MDADEILNRIRATTWDDEHDRETFSMSRPAALELLRTRLSPEPAAPDAGEIESLRRERDEARKALAETEADLEALAAPCGTIQQRITVEREKYRLACDERDAARTDLAAAVGLLEECFLLMPKHEGVNFRTLWQRVGQFIAARKEAPK